METYNTEAYDMETYDVKCPACGTLNRSCYLDETNGWMECEYCGQASQYLRYKETQVPVLMVRNLQRTTAPRKEAM